jgi:RNA methyltransferase, TrmH family
VVAWRAIDGAVSIGLPARFREARSDPGLVVLEGFHALKHALRFEAEVLEAVAVDSVRLRRMAADLAPDLAGVLGARVKQVGEGELAELVPRPPRTGVVAIARRPAIDVAAALADPRSSPLLLLEDPRSMGNLGACVRVAAAASVAGVFSTGRNDPWNPEAVRGAAGLQFALPVAAVESLPESDRPLVAIDPGGEELRPGELPARAVLAFGSERHGLSAALLDRADLRLGIPMRPGVSSLNLATSVAAVLFLQRWTGTAASG